MGGGRNKQCAEHGANCKVMSAFGNMDIAHWRPPPDDFRHTPPSYHRHPEVRASAASEPRRMIGPDVDTYGPSPFEARPSAERLRVTVVHLSLWHLCSPHRAPDLFRRGRQIDVAHAEHRERVHQRV